MRFNLLLSLMLLALVDASAQKLSISKMEMVSDQLVVHYKIDDPISTNEYLVSLYSSKDNFSTPLTKVVGDIGQEVRPGDLKVVWAIRDEYGDFKGPLSVELRANVYIPFVRLKSFTSTKRYKRGKSYPLDWRPGTTNPVHIELFRGSQRLQGELNHPNNGSYAVNFASSLKPGSGYRIKITNSKTPDDFVYSQKFRVKRKVPLLLKALPFLAGGYFASTLLGSSSTGDMLPDAPQKP